LAQLEIRIQKHFASNASGQGFELDASLECDAGVTVLFGASGAGKTLTLEAVAGFLRPDTGRILLNNQILFDGQSGVFLPPQRRGVGYVFQNYALFPHMTVAQNLSFGISRLPGLERHRRVREMLGVFGLEPHAGRRPHELSGGEKQRASIARALICQPRLLLLDEPVRGLDFQLRAEFYAVVRRIRSEYRIPILLVTHDVSETFALAEKVAVYRGGRVVQEGGPGEVFAHPRSPAVARLLGYSNIFRGVIEELDPMAGSSLIRTQSFSLTAPYLPGKLRGDTVAFCIPAEQLQLIPFTDGGRVEQQNKIPVHITDEIEAPAALRLIMRIEPRNGDKTPATPQQIETEISRAAYKKMSIATQKKWYVALPKAAIHVFPDQQE
jgi:molybdate transport system ATP-binding protein